MSIHIRERYCLNRYTYVRAYNSRLSIVKLEINYVPCMLLYNSNCVLVRNYKPLLALYKLQTIPRIHGRAVRIQLVE